LLGFASSPVDGILATDENSSSSLFSNRTNYTSRTTGGVTLTGSGDCNLCGGAATIRFVLALDSYEKETRLVLQNIPVPILWQR